MGSGWSRNRDARAAAACFTPDIAPADDGLPLTVLRTKALGTAESGPTASKPSTTYDLPMCHKPCDGASATVSHVFICVLLHPGSDAFYAWWVSVCMRVFSNNLCCVQVVFQCVHLSSLVYPLLLQLYSFVSFNAQFRLILSIY